MDLFSCGPPQNGTVAPPEESGHPSVGEDRSGPDSCQESERSRGFLRVWRPLPRLRFPCLWVYSFISILSLLIYSCVK